MGRWEHWTGDDPKRICILKPSALGDVVQTMPILPVLRWRFPNAHFAWVINKELAPLLEGHPDLDEIIPFERKGGVSSWFKLASKLRRSRFDLVLDLQGLLRTGLMAWVTGAKTRLGLETAREGASFFTHALISETNNQVPAHARYWRIAEFLGYPGEKSTSIPVPESCRQEARALIAKLPRPLLGIHAGARWETKRWPVDRFVEVATKIQPGSIVLVGSQSEIPITKELESKLQQSIPVLNLGGATTLKQLAATLAELDWLLCNDSGPMHLASAMGTKVVGIFTCTDPLRSGPSGDHLLIQSSVDCAGSYCKTCPKKGQKYLACMDELTSEAVVEQFNGIELRRAG